MLCRLCRNPMIDNGKGFWVCSTPGCDYICTIPQPAKSKAELLEENTKLKQENEKLKKIINQMNKELSHNAPQTT